MEEAPLFQSKLASPDDLPSMLSDTNFLVRGKNELFTNASFVDRFSNRQDKKLLPRISEWINAGDPNVLVELDGMKIKSVSCAGDNWDEEPKTAMHAVAKAYEGKTVTAGVMRSLGDDMFAAYRRQFMTQRERDDEAVGEAAKESDFDAVGSADDLALLTNERFPARFGDPAFDPRAKELLARIGTEKPGMKIALNGTRIKGIRCIPDRWNGDATAMRETAKAYEGKTLSAAVLRDLARDMHAAFKKQLLRPDELRNDRLETVCRETDFQVSGKDMLLSSNFFLDRFRSKELVKRIREWARSAGPFIRAHLNDNAIKSVEIVTDGAWAKGGTVMHDVAKRFEGKALNVETLRALSDEMYAALSLEFEDKGPLMLSGILPTEWRVRETPSEWSRAQTDTAKKWTKEVQGKGQQLSELPEIVSKKTVRKRQRLPDGTSVSIDAVSDTLITCTVTRPDGRSETWGVTGCVTFRRKADGKILEQYSSCVLFQMHDFRGRKAAEARPLTTLMHEDGGLDLEKIAKQTTAVLTMRHQEETDPGRVRRLDMPTKEPIGYIGLHDGSDDLIKELKPSISGMPALLAKKHNMYCAPGSECIDVNKPPADVIREQLQAYRRKGISCAYINIAAHGNPNGLKFKGGILRPADLRAIFKEFSDMLIVVNALSCMGGNLASAFTGYEREVGERDKVVFLHTKPDTLLNSHKIGERSDSAYNVFLCAALAKGKSYMEAHVEADELAKLYDGSNAEVWIARSGGNDRLSAAPDAGRPTNA